MISVAITRQLSAALKALLVLTVLLGVLYPAAILAVGLVVPGQANGSLSRSTARSSDPACSARPPRVRSGSRPAPRPPTTAASPAAARISAELSGPRHPVAEREAALREANPDAPATIPPDALTASSSGLDPHISPAYAAYQAPRVAAARG